MKKQKQPCRKKPYEKVIFEHKLFVFDHIRNHQISAKFASKKYDIPRSTITRYLRFQKIPADIYYGLSKVLNFNKCLSLNLE